MVSGELSKGLPKTADVVIVGSGVQGASIAYNLAKMGVRDVLVLDAGDLLIGSTGRCAAGIRAQWGGELNCKLAKASLDIFETLSDELGMDIGLHQGGYLIVAYLESEFQQLKRNVQLQNSLGINSVILSHDEVKERFPALDISNAVGFTYHHRDGHADPFLTTLAYIEGAKRLGVNFFFRTRVTGIEVRGDKVEGVQTSKGYISTKVVVNAAGPWARDIAQMVGLSIPVEPEAHEIVVTEPVPRILDPMVISFSGNFYMQQRPNGSFIMGMGPEPYAHPQDQYSLTWKFPYIMAQKVTKLLPALRKVRLLRHWAGYYAVTPDRHPILGESKYVKGFYMSVGFSGHGFMLAPITGKLIAEMITGKEPSIDVSSLRPERFEEGKLVFEPMVV